MENHDAGFFPVRMLSIFRIVMMMRMTNVNNGCLLPAPGSRRSHSQLNARALVLKRGSTVFPGDAHPLLVQ